MKSSLILLYNAFPRKMEGRYGILQRTREIRHDPPLVGHVREILSQGQGVALPVIKTPEVKSMTNPCESKTWCIIPVVIAVKKKKKKISLDFCLRDNDILFVCFQKAFERQKLHVLSEC